LFWSPSGENTPQNNNNNKNNICDSRATKFPKSEKFHCKQNAKQRRRITKRNRRIGTLNRFCFKMLISGACVSHRREDLVMTAKLPIN
jgi:hypothetical protein